jgi:hypothetical protein
MKPSPRRYPSINHTITLEQGGMVHEFEITITFKPITDSLGILVPFNIIFNNVAGDLSGLPILMDQLGQKLSKILEEMYE